MYKQEEWQNTPFLHLMKEDSRIQTKAVHECPIKKRLYWDCFLSICIAQMSYYYDKSGDINDML